MYNVSHVSYILDYKPGFYLFHDFFETRLINETRLLFECNKVLAINVGLDFQRNPGLMRQASIRSSSTCS